MTGERRRREWAEEFDIIWHGALPTDGTSKGGLLQPCEQKVDPRWALLDSMGGPGAFKDGSMQSTRKRIMAKGQRGVFHRTLCWHGSHFVSAHGPKWTRRTPSAWPCAGSGRDAHE